MNSGDAIVASLGIVQGLGKQKRAEEFHSVWGIGYGPLALVGLTSFNRRKFSSEKFPYSVLSNCCIWLELVFCLFVICF